MAQSALNQSPTIKLSASTLDQYAAAAGQKYIKLTQRIKQKVKSVPVLNKVVKTVRDWDQKMLKKHGAAYKFAKGAVIGASIGIGLAAAGPQVITAYAAVNAVRATSGLLVQAEKARQNGQANGFSDFAAKNKTAIGLAAVSIGISAAGITAGVIENQAAAAIISSARQAAAGGMMTASTATKKHKISTDAKHGKLTKEQAQKAKKETYAELAGNLTGLLAVSAVSSYQSAQQQSGEPATTVAQQPEVASSVNEIPQDIAQTPVPEIQNEPEAVPVSSVPEAEPVIEEQPVNVTQPEPAPEKPAPATPEPQPVVKDQPVPKVDPKPIVKETPPVVPETKPIMAEQAPVVDDTPINVEKDTFVSYSQQVSPTTHTINLDISDSNHVSDTYESSSLFVEVQDIEGSEAKLMSMHVSEGGEYSGTPTLHIDENGNVTELPDWHQFPDANGDCHLSKREIRNWTAKRQASLETVLSEQEAHNVTMMEIKEDMKRYNGDNIYSVESEQNSGSTRYDGPASGLNQNGLNASDKVRDIGTKHADNIANSAKELMCNRIDQDGNACQVKATEKQIQVADILLRSAASKIR